MANSQEADFAIMIGLLREISAKLDKSCSCASADGTQTSPQTSPQPFMPTPAWTGCNVCGRPAFGATGYVCTQPLCPTRVTS